MVFDTHLLVRSDRKTDRVEISPEQLSLASQAAEERARALGIPVRVIGWYHSHPRMNPEPSHVDLR